MINKDHANDNFDFKKIKMFGVAAMEKVRNDVHQNTLNHIKDCIADIKHSFSVDEMYAIDDVANLFEYLYDCMESPNYNEYYKLVHSELSKLNIIK